MAQLFNYTLTFQATATYTAESYDEAVQRLEEDEGGDVIVVDSNCEDFDPDLDDYMNGR